METTTITTEGMTFGSEQDRWEFQARSGAITLDEFFAKADAEGWVTA